MKSDIKKTVLIIDDDENILDMYSAKFLSSGYNVLLAASGADGLKIAFENHPDIILLDVQMSDMRGTDVLNNLRDDDWGESVPVILLTNMQADTKEIIKTIVKKRPSLYLVKTDWTPAQVEEKTREILDDVVQ